MDTTISRSQKVISLLWSLVLLILLVFFVYWLFKNGREDSENRSLLTTGKQKKKRKKTLAREKDETSLIEYPKYNLDKTNKIVMDEISGTQDTHFFTYQDLFKIIEEKDMTFFNEYLKAVINANIDKRKLYIKHLQKYEDKYSNVADNSNAIRGYNEQENKTKKIKDIFEEIIEAIDNVINNLDEEKLYDQFRLMIWNKSRGLESLVGRMEFKNFIARSIYTFKNNPKGSYTSFQNLLILGNSGIGKSKLAECMAYAYCMSGIVSRFKYDIVKKDDYVSRFVNATGGDTRNMLIEYLEGFLIFEEIYTMTPDKSESAYTVDHGKEAIDVLVDFAEDFKGLSHIAAVGYEKPTIIRFLNANEGMERRFPKRIILHDYDNKELTHILVRGLLDSSSISLNQSEVDVLHGMIVACLSENPDIFKKQAGDMKNIASEITETIFSMVDEKWSLKNSKNNIRLLFAGFNNYLMNGKNKFILGIENGEIRAVVDAK